MVAMAYFHIYFEFFEVLENLVLYYHVPIVYTGRVFFEFGMQRIM